MTVLTEEKAFERVEKSNDRITRILRDKKHSSENRGKHGQQGRKEGQENLNDFARALIGTAAHFDSRESVAKELGVSVTSVSNFKNGKLATEQVENGQVVETVSKDVKKIIKTRLDDITDKATDRILKVLGEITDERIETVKEVKDLTVIAKNLSAVVEKANPKENGNVSAVQVNLFVPPQKDEKEFESIPVVYSPIEER